MFFPPLKIIIAHYGRKPDGDNDDKLFGVPAVNSFYRNNANWGLNQPAFAEMRRSE
jgi:hypothetical protein